MYDRSRRRQAAAIAVLAGVVLLVFLAAILAVIMNSQKEELAKESGVEILQTEDMTFASDFVEEPETVEESCEESESASEPVPEPVLSQAEVLLAQMSTREKVYQLFMVFPSQVTGVSPVTKAGDLTRQGLADFPVGGFIYDKTNMVSREQVTEMLTTVQTHSKIPLILTCDEEGGRLTA